MRALFWGIVVLAAIYGGYWFVGARAAERGAEAALVRLAGEGIAVKHDGLGVAGFPSRFDLTLTAPQVSIPARGIGWAAPFAQIFSLSYKPWHLIAALPEDQKLTLPGQALTLASTRMMGSLRLTPSPDLPLAEADAVAEGVSLRSDQGWALGFASANLRLARGEGDNYEVALRVLDLVPDQALVAGLAGSGLPATVARLDALADVALDGPLALRDAVPPAISAVTLREANIVWGPLTLRATGRLVADAQGRGEGQIDLRVEGWRAGFEAAVALRLIPDRFVQAVESVLVQMETQSGAPGVLTLPLVMRNGRMMLGPVPLGAAPLLR
ncbi:hypothetical protein SAMN04488103_11296 [Gemmobacter aquatilis]|uniref:DUF2125 domain-containing protein n=1 Tax=Gemmobacter aquatilis TaxID=933059 RepID=A0A1H8M7C4_9RHOB|nr:DUF2125 domain-containing protein [Gemmobacter aquatilis]SEO13046.1 hypothetical protein SAMN04488103_11296 [Gemmobacter aquatilis]